MKTIKLIISSLLFMVTFIACEKDGDTIYLTGLEESDFIITTNEVVLSKENAKQVVLSLAWNNTTTLVVSDPNIYAPDILTLYTEVSTHEDFSDNIIETRETSNSKAYMGSELNILAKNLGIEPDIPTSIYFRIKASMGNNIDAKYSEVMEVVVTSYFIDMTVGHVLDSKMVETGITLSSPDANGIYNGFMGVPGWYNYYLLEGDGKTWGNDGVDGSPFLLSSEEDASKRWNFWFPGQSGCYYVDVNTIKKQWSALFIPTLTVSGDINTDMTFDRSNVKWTAAYQATTAGTLTIQLNGNGKLYDYSTGDKDETAVDASITFSEENGELILSEQAGNITIDVPEAGSYLLVVDLSNPKSFACRLEAGTIIEPEARKIYAVGLDDRWEFDVPLTETSTENIYSGQITFSHASEWGFQIHLDDSWSNYYGGSDGILYFQGDNIKDDATLAPGTYTMTVNLNDNTYSITQ